MAKIVLEKDKCIGCGTCAALCPEFWEVEGGKATIKGAQKKSGDREELDAKLDDKQIECNKQCEENCPVACIQVNK